MNTFAPRRDVRAVVFDCDGVLLESVACKGDAFRRLFQHEAGHLDEIVAFHFANGGMSRYAKFDHIYAHMLRRPLSDADREALANRFGELVMEEVVACPMVAGARELLAALEGQLPLFVASATPQDELAAILDRRGLLATFERVWGYPTTKAEAVRAAARLAGCAVDAVVFIGDARADYEAAEETGCRFIGRQPPDGTRPFDGTKVLVVPDCLQILDWMRE